ncbi:RAD3 DNA-binding helicase protein [Trifolium repens]|nr:RAD3 DNA-binding helicase protein [Trifolium repens]
MTRSEAAPVMLGGAMVFPQVCLRVEEWTTSSATQRSCAFERREHEIDLILTIGFWKEDRSGFNLLGHQKAKEWRKTAFADVIDVVSLGSRKNLCINQEVLALANSTRINERCLDK